MSGNRPTSARCPLCSSALCNPRPGKDRLRLYCEVCRRFIHIGGKKPYGRWPISVREELRALARRMLAFEDLKVQPMGELRDEEPKKLPPLTPGEDYDDRCDMENPEA